MYEMTASHLRDGRGVLHTGYVRIYIHICYINTYKYGSICSVYIYVKTKNSNMKGI
jgi:hypothetical protein